MTTTTNPRGWTPEQFARLTTVDRLALPDGWTCRQWQRSNLILRIRVASTGSTGARRKRLARIYQGLLRQWWFETSTGFPL